ncbi:MAG: acyl transferase [Microcoleaceae cyanobacterium]
MSLFPALIILISAALFLWLLYAPRVLVFIALIFLIYGFPLLVYRVHHYFYPVKSGISYLQDCGYSPWWGSHQIQAIYIAFPIFETVLRLIPGAFSCWLRLWGSQIGKDVCWTSQLEIADRGLLEIGDRVVFGHGVGLYSHIIKPKKQNLMLYIKPIKIGSDTFLGAWNHIGPGVKIESSSYLPVATHLYPNRKINESIHTK